MCRRERGAHEHHCWVTIPSLLLTSIPELERGQVTRVVQACERQDEHSTTETSLAHCQFSTPHLCVSCLVHESASIFSGTQESSIITRQKRARMQQKSQERLCNVHALFKSWTFICSIIHRCCKSRPPIFRRSRVHRSRLLFLQVVQIQRIDHPYHVAHSDVAAAVVPRV